MKKKEWKWEKKIKLEKGQKLGKNKISKKGKMLGKETTKNEKKMEKKIEKEKKQQNGKNGKTKVETKIKPA